MENTKLKELKNKVLSGYKVDRDDIYDIIDAPLEELKLAAIEIRDNFFENKFDLCTIINGKSGKCSENCKFCAQSAFYSTGAEEYGLLNSCEIVDSACKNYSDGVNRFSIVTSGRKLSDKELDYLSKVYKDIANNCPINLCASHGLLSYEDLMKLKEAGVSRYHNNLETSREFFPNVCTTHSFENKIDTIKAAKKAGLSICSGGIFGLGESMDDRIDMAFTLRDLEVDSVPINILNPIAGTPFETNKILDYDEIQRVISLYRFILPEADLRLAGGRSNLNDAGKKAINSGVNSMISGDMLTTQGIDTNTDIEMIKKLGMENIRE